MNVMLTSKDASARVRRWQRGGTVTGVIVGLIVGLTVAVWVAMTILKTPLPFVDKISKQSQPAGELGDPNKTMPGGARERRERISEDQPAAPAAQPVAVTPSEQSAAAKSAKTAKAEAPPAATAPATLPPSEKSRAEKAPTTANTSSQPSSPTPAANSANSNPPPASNAASNAASTPATAATAAPSLAPPVVQEHIIACRYEGGVAARRLTGGHETHAVWDRTPPLQEMQTKLAELSARHNSTT
jgi:cell division protein FtsN